MSLKPKNISNNSSFIQKNQKDKIDGSTNLKKEEFYDEKFIKTPKNNLVEEQILSDNDFINTNQTKLIDGIIPENSCVNLLSIKLNKNKIDGLYDLNRARYIENLIDLKIVEKLNEKILNNKKTQDLLTSYLNNTIKINEELISLNLYKKITNTETDDLLLSLNKAFSDNFGIYGLNLYLNNEINSSYPLLNEKQNSDLSNLLNKLSNIDHATLSKMSVSTLFLQILKDLEYNFLFGVMPSLTLKRDFSAIDNLKINTSSTNFESVKINMLTDSKNNLLDLIQKNDINSASVDKIIFHCNQLSNSIFLSIFSKNPIGIPLDYGILLGDFDKTIGTNGTTNILDDSKVEKNSLADKILVQKDGNNSVKTTDVGVLSLDLHSINFHGKKFLGSSEAFFDNLNESITSNNVSTHKLLIEQLENKINSVLTSLLNTTYNKNLNKSLNLFKSENIFKEIHKNIFNKAFFDEEKEIFVDSDNTEILKDIIKHILVEELKTQFPQKSYKTFSIIKDEAKKFFSNKYHSDNSKITKLFNYLDNILGINKDLINKKTYIYEISKFIESIFTNKEITDDYKTINKNQISYNKGDIDWVINKVLTIYIYCIKESSNLFFTQDSQQYKNLIDKITFNNNSILYYLFILKTIIHARKTTLNKLYDISDYILNNPKNSPLSIEEKEACKVAIKYSNVLNNLSLKQLEFSKYRSDNITLLSNTLNVQKNYHAVNVSLDYLKNYFKNLDSNLILTFIGIPRGTIKNISNQESKNINDLKINLYCKITNDELPQNINIKNYDKKLISEFSLKYFMNENSFSNSNNFIDNWNSYLANSSIFDYAKNNIIKYSSLNKNDKIFANNEISSFLLKKMVNNLIDINVDEYIVSKTIDIKYSKNIYDIFSILFNADKVNSIKKMFKQDGNFLIFNNNETIKNLLKNELSYNEIKIIEILLKNLSPNLFLNEYLQNIVFNPTTFDYVFGILINLEDFKINNSNSDLFLSTCQFELEVI